MLYDTFMPSYHRPFRKYTDEEKLEYIRRQIGNSAKPTKKSIDRICAEIGLLISQSRRDMAISQRELGMRLGTYQSVIARIESGKHNIRIKNLEKIAKILGKKVEITLS